MMNPRRDDHDSLLIVALTGASGISYGLRLLKYTNVIRRKYDLIYVVYTENATRVASVEEKIDLRNYLLSCEVDKVYSENDLDAPIASSSRLISSDMVIIPASLNTIAKIANGIQDNLVTRAACNILRLRRKLIIVPRETPLSTIDLRNLLKLSIAGAIILPASPALYPRPRTIDDIVDFIVGKVLDVLNIDHNIYLRWGTSSTDV
ncbi:MAG: UbiX family flavin prenyltransferase [Desulfurococcaceae archaeon]